MANSPVKKLLLSFAGMALLASCQTATTAAPTRVERPVYGDVVAFAQAACGGCHAVEHDALSPDVMAPEWPNIVNSPEVTADTLRRWLIDAHNYPEEMDFELNRPQIEELVTYMMSLKRSGYEPPI